MNKAICIMLISYFTLGMKVGIAQQSVLLKNESKIDSLLQQMTLEEKINMLHGKFMFTSAGVERLGIADMVYTDGPFGIREEMQPNGWASLGLENDKATFFPTGSALGATWSPELAYEYGTGMAREARFRGKDMILGPAINIQRLPTGGRTYEYMSEDPHLSAALAVGYTKGVQDNGVAACIKHYALNNQENNRGTVNVIVGERAMREIYLAPFKAAVTEADAFGVMSAYNKVNGWWCAENDMLLNKILRNEWGFAGLVVSDWNGTHSTVASIVNGLNVEMPSKRFLGQALLDSVKAGKVSMDVINLRVKEILRVRLVIESVPQSEANKIITSQPPQQKIAYNIASKSIVLLKNDGILPLSLSKKPTIAVIGDNAERKMASGGVGAGVKSLYEITPLEGLKNRIGDKAEIIYAKGYEPAVFNWARMFRGRTKEQIEKEEQEKALRNDSLNNEAIQIAAKADIVIFFAGNNRSVETEASDRKDIKLPSGQDSLMVKLAQVNKNIVTILVSGAPNDLNTVQPNSNALLISWFNGSEGGNALADVLVGNISPSGRLPFTLPVKLEDSPAYALGNYPQGEKGKDVFVDLVEETEGDQKQTTRVKNDDPNTAYYSEESLVGYRWFETKNIPVVYPFGYGLTYTTFEYSNLTTNKKKFNLKDRIELTFDLKNTGSKEADEVVQVYVNRINPSVEWPLKELKAFQRVTLKPLESQQVKLSIPIEKLMYWNAKEQKWDHDPCDIELMVGSSVSDIKLKKRVTVK